MSGETELNKSEEATPFKLEQARRKGTIARGMDLGFFAALAGFLLYLSSVGSVSALRLSAFTRATLGNFRGADDPSHVLASLANGWALLISIVLGLGLTLVAIVLPLEIFQLRGFSFSAQPLKPDFKRLNPALGLKRLFSLKMLKEALKNLVKFAIYATIATIAVRSGLDRLRSDVGGGREFAAIIWSESLKLLAMFVAAALIIAAIDQLIVRREFGKQMRMSRSELTRENKEREGEPRLKAKRKQLHAEFIKQTQGLGKLAGADVVVVNPEHFAVALAYDAQTMSAPLVRARARNKLALAMRGEAARLQIPVITDAPLARALFRNSSPGREIAPEFFRDVARLYTKLRAGQE